MWCAPVPPRIYPNIYCSSGTLRTTTAYFSYFCYFLNGWSLKQPVYIKASLPMAVCASYVLWNIFPSHLVSHLLHVKDPPSPRGASYWLIVNLNVTWGSRQAQGWKDKWFWLQRRFLDQFLQADSGYAHPKRSKSSPDQVFALTSSYTGWQSGPRRQLYTCTRKYRY